MPKRSPASAAAAAALAALEQQQSLGAASAHPTGDDLMLLDEPAYLEANPEAARARDAVMFIVAELRPWELPMEHRHELLDAIASTARHGSRRRPWLSGALPRGSRPHREWGATSGALWLWFCRWHRAYQRSPERFPQMEAITRDISSRVWKVVNNIDNPHIQTLGFVRRALMPEWRQIRKHVRQWPESRRNAALEWMER